MTSSNRIRSLADIGYSRFHGWLPGHLCVVSMAVFLGAGGCSEAGEKSPSPWGQADNVVYVKSSGNRPADTPAAGDGSKSSPFATISEAILFAEETADGSKGTVILVEPGVYFEALEIRVQELNNPPLQVQAWSPDSEQQVEFELRPPAGSPAGIMLVGPGGGVPELVKLVGARVVDATSVGIWVAGARVEMSRCRIEGAVGTPALPFGYGVLVTDSAEMTVADSQVIGSERVGILVKSAVATVAKTLVEDNTGGGIRFEKSDGFVVDDCDVQDNGIAGISAFSSAGEILDTSIEGTLPPADAVDSQPASADGIVIGELFVENAGQGPSAVLVERNVVSDNARVGVLLSDGATGHVVDNVVSGNQRAGIWVQYGGAGEGFEVVQIAKNQVLDNKYIAVGVTHGARVEIEDNLIGATVPVVHFEGVEMLTRFGDGIGLFENAQANISGNVLVKNHRVDILLDSAGEGTTVDSTNERESGAIDKLLIVQQEASLEGDVTVGLATADWVDFQQFGPGESVYELMEEAVEGFKNLVGPGGGVPEYTP